MELAIRKAVDNGYKPKKIDYGFKWDEYSIDVDYKISKSACLIDPLFWQALGKSLRWGSDAHNWNTSGDKCDYCGAYDDDTVPPGAYNYCWRYWWHCFIDHRAEGNSVDSFFEQLTTQKHE